MQPRLNRPAPQRIQILEAVNFDRDYIIPSTPGGDKKWSFTLYAQVELRARPLDIQKAPL